MIKKIILITVLSMSSLSKGQSDINLLKKGKDLGLFCDNFDNIRKCKYLLNDKIKVEIDVISVNFIDSLNLDYTIIRNGLFEGEKLAVNFYKLGSNERITLAKMKRKYCYFYQFIKDLSMVQILYAQLAFYSDYRRKRTYIFDNYDLRILDEKLDTIKTFDLIDERKYICRESVGITLFNKDLLIISVNLSNKQNEINMVKGRLFFFSLKKYSLLKEVDFDRRLTDMYLWRKELTVVQLSDQGIKQPLYFKVE